MTITVRVALALTSAAGLLAALPAAPAHAAVVEIQLTDTLPGPVTAGAVTLRRTTSASINLLQASVAIAPDGTQLQYTAARDVVNGQVTTMQPRRIGLLNPATGAETVIRPATGTARSVRAGGLTAGWAVWAEGGSFRAGDSTDVRVLAYNRTARTTTLLRRFVVSSPGQQWFGDGVAILGDRAYWSELLPTGDRMAIFSRALNGAGAVRREATGAGRPVVDQCAPAGSPALVYGVWAGVAGGVTPNNALVVHRRVVAGPQAGTDTVIGRFTFTPSTNFTDPVACGAAIAFQRDELVANQLVVRRLVRLVADGRTVDLALPQGFEATGLTLSARALGLAGRGLDFPGGEYLYHRARQTAYAFGPALGVQQSAVPTARVLLNGTAVGWRGLSGLSYTTSVGTVA